MNMASKKIKDTYILSISGNINKEHIKQISMELKKILLEPVIRYVLDLKGAEINDTSFFKEITIFNYKIKPYERKIITVNASKKIINQVNSQGLSRVFNLKGDI